MLSEVPIEAPIIPLEELALGVTIGRGASFSVRVADWGSRRVAVKISHILENPEAYGLAVGSPEYRMAGKELIKEANLYASLNNRNVVEFYGLVVDPSTHAPKFLVYEQANCDVRQWLRSKSLISASELASLLVQVLRGLVYLHGKGPEPIIHGDLKPDNILVFISDEGVIFKLADLVTPDELRSGGFGAAFYRSPESVRGEAATPAADIFSLGIIIAEIVLEDLHFGPKPGADSSLSLRTSIHEFGVERRAEMITAACGKLESLPMLASILQNATAADPTARPTANELLDLASSYQMGFEVGSHELRSLVAQRDSTLAVLSEEVSQLNTSVKRAMTEASDARQHAEASERRALEGVAQAVSRQETLERELAATRAQAAEVQTICAGLLDTNEAQADEIRRLRQDLSASIQRVEQTKAAIEAYQREAASVSTALLGLHTRLSTLPVVLAPPIPAAPSGNTSVALRPPIPVFPDCDDCRFLTEPVWPHRGVHVTLPYDTSSTMIVDDAVKAAIRHQLQTRVVSLAPYPFQGTHMSSGDWAPGNVVTAISIHFYGRLVRLHRGNCRRCEAAVPGPWPVMKVWLAASDPEYTHGALVDGATSNRVLRTMGESVPATVGLPSLARLSLSPPPTHEVSIVVVFCAMCRRPV